MTFEQIGQKLKTARESQGLTLTQIWEKTKIPMHHLQSVETGVTDDLPETVYVAGFIKRYGDAVGLNGQALSEEYRREAVNESSGNGNGHHLRAPKMPKGGGPSLVAVPAPYMGKNRVDSGSPSILKHLVFPSLLILMVVSLFALYVKMNADNAINQPDQSILNLNTNKLNAIPASAPNVPPPTGGPTTPGAATPTTQGPAAATGLNAAITASKTVWVEVKSVSSNETLYSDTLQAGANRIFNDPQGIRVRSGSAGSVNIEIDGKSEVLGPPGKKVERTFLAKGASATPTATADTANGSGSVLGTAATATKPVKKVVKKASSDATNHHRFRAIDEAPSRQYIPGESLGGTRSIDVPYRYNDGRLDTDN